MHTDDIDPADHADADIGLDAQDVRTDDHDPRAVEALFTNPRTDPRKVTRAEAMRTLTTAAEIDDFLAANA